MILVKLGLAILVIATIFVIPIYLFFNFYFAVIYPVDVAKSYIIAATSVNDIDKVVNYLEKSLRTIENYSGYVGMWYDPRYDFAVVKDRIRTEIEACRRFANVSTTTYQYQRFMEEVKDELNVIAKDLGDIGMELYLFSSTAYRIPVNGIYLLIYIAVAIFVLAIAVELWDYEPG